MGITKTEHPHIIRAKGVCGGRPIIKGTRIPVWLIAGWFKDGYSPERIKQEIYSHLSLAQIYDALSYYHDHQDEIDSEIVANTPAEGGETALSVAPRYLACLLPAWPVGQAGRCR